ncbi:MAG: amino acid permease [Anaerolineales bacterium]|nr:amino acid permease [Anaerolineales bacterium]
MTDSSLPDGSANDPGKRGQMTMLGATFLGIGAMVGAGIFTLLGEAAAIAGSAVWIAFAIAGFVSLLQGYSYAKFGVRYPSRGGVTEFWRQGFGDGHMLGVSSWLLFFTSVIVTAMVAVSFGSYLGTLLFGEGVSLWTINLLASVLMVGVAAVVLAGAEAVNKAQTIIVSVLLLVFAVFIFATLTAIDPSLLSPSTYPPFSDIAGAVALTFFAFLGFGVVVFSAGDLSNPKKELPRAVYLSILVAGAIYIAVSIGVMGVMTVDEVIASGATALADAAKPVLGQAGYVMMALAALLATASSASSNTFAAGGVTSTMGQSGQFPPVFGRARRRGRGEGTVGVVITMLIVILLIWVYDLSAIASLGSAIGLLVFSLASIAHLRVIDQTGAQRWLIVLGLVATIAVLVSFIATTLVNEPATLRAAVLLIVLSIVLDYGWKAVRDRRESPGGS